MAIPFAKILIKELKHVKISHNIIRNSQKDKIFQLPSVLNNNNKISNVELNSYFFKNLSSKHKNKIRHITDKNKIQNRILNNIALDGSTLDTSTSGNKYHFMDINDYIEKKS